VTTWSDRLALIITADTKGAVAGLEAVGTTAERELTKAQTSLDATGRNLTRFGVGSIAAGAVIGAGLYKAAQAYDEAHKSALQLENTIRNQPQLAGANAKALEGLAQSIQHKTAADGDEIVAGMAKLGMYGLTEKQLRDITPLVVDYARKTGKDMVSAFADVGKAANGQTRALKAAGVVIDANAYETDRLGAITDALTKSVGGFAEREGKTFSGQMQRLKNDAHDLAEGLGKGVTQALGDLTDGVDKATRGFGALGEDGQATIGRFATYGAGVLVLSGAVSVVGGQVIKFRDQIKAIPELLDKLSVSAYNGAGKVDGLAAAIRGVSPSLALGVSAAAASILAFSIDTSKAAKSAKELRTEAEASGRTIKEELARNLADLASSDKVQAFLDKSGQSVDDLVKAVTSGDDALNAFIGNIVRSYGEANSANVMGLEDFQLSLFKQAKEYREAVRGQKAYEQGLSALGKALDTTKAKTEDLTNAQTDELSAQFAYGQATTDLAGAQADAASVRVDAADKSADAARNEREAERDLRDAQRDTADAIADIGNAYDEARRQAEDYKNAVTEGGFSVREAQFGVADAQQALTEAQAKGDPTEIAKAQLRLEEAQYRLEQANKDLTDAQDNLNEANRKGLDRSPQVLAAQQRVKDAKDRERDATDRLTQAEKDRKTAVDDGAKAIDEANGKILEAVRKQEEAWLVLIATLRILREEQRQADGYIVPGNGSTRGGKPDDPGGANGGRVPTGGRSAAGRKGGDTYISVTIDGETQTTRSAIHKGIEKANKQAALTYGRRFAA